MIVNYYLIFLHRKGVAPLASFHKMLTCVNNWNDLKLVKKGIRELKNDKRQFLGQVRVKDINKPLKGNTNKIR